MKAISIQDKQFIFDSEHKVYCTNPKCSGHGVVFRMKKQERKLCPNCNKWIYRNPLIKLKYEMKERGILNDK